MRNDRWGMRGDDGEDGQDIGATRGSEVHTRITGGYILLNHPLEWHALAQSFRHRGCPCLP